jgi:hypothetical protein
MSTSAAIASSPCEISSHSPIEMNSPPPLSHRDRLTRKGKEGEEEEDDWERGELGSHLEDEALAARDCATARCCPPSGARDLELEERVALMAAEQKVVL